MTAWMWDVVVSTHMYVWSLTAAFLPACVPGCALSKHCLRLLDLPLPLPLLAFLSLPFPSLPSALSLPACFRTHHSLLTLHMWLCLRRLRAEGPQGAAVGQVLYDLFNHDTEKRVVEAGVRRGGRGRGREGGGVSE